MNNCSVPFNNNIKTNKSCEEVWTNSFITYSSDSPDIFKPEESSFYNKKTKNLDRPCILFNDIIKKYDNSNFPLILSELDNINSPEQKRKFLRCLYHGIYTQFIREYVSAIKNVEINYYKKSLDEL